ncbi:hypothetical protein DVH05_005605 [Phytophthora capsici]|nr:hypothetical protein DVH05_005605 [Phytophthora capsici]
MGRAKRHPPGTSDGIPKRRRLPVRAGTNVKPTVLREGTCITLFKEIWRLLRQDGWTAKPPRRSSLDTRYRYVNPGQDPNGIEGEDYFLGEDALVLYYRGLNKQAIRVDGDIVTIIPTKPGSDAVVVSELGASGVNGPVHCDESDFQSDEREFGETTLRLVNKGRLGGGIHGELGNENGGRVGARHGVEQGRFSYEDEQGDDSSEDKHEGDMHEGPGDLGAEENGVRCEDGQAHRGGHRGNGDTCCLNSNNHSH